MRPEYEQDGYVILRGRIPAEVVENARREAYALHEASGGRFGFHGAFVHEDGTQWHRRRVHGLKSVESILGYLPVRELLRPDPCGITHSKFSYKCPGEDQTWAPHQDVGYKPELRYGAVFAVPLEPVDMANGTLELQPRSHRDGMLPHRTLPGGTHGQIELAEPREGAFVPLVASPGDIAAFSMYTVHRSGPNRSHGLRVILFVEVEPGPERLEDELGGPVTRI